VKYVPHDRVNKNLSSVKHVKEPLITDHQVETCEDSLTGPSRGDGKLNHVENRSYKDEHHTSV